MDPDEVGRAPAGELARPVMQAPEPDRGQLARFINATFAHAGEGGLIALRAFYDDEIAKKRGSRPFKTITVRINGDGLRSIIEPAFRLAVEAARADRPVVMAPPIATFRGGKTDEKNLREGLVLSVELDERAADALTTLRAILGPPTLVMQSGGEWVDPGSGELYPKLHVHWRLKEPTQTPEEHARLKRARTLACEAVGADATAKPIVHPLRWAGTLHRKNPDAPQLARIVEENVDAEIILEDALAELEGLVALRGIARGAPEPRRSDAQNADGELLIACAERIANSDLEWAAWNRIGMAFWRASSGSEAGFQAFDTFSRKSTKHDPEATQARWRHYATSPPTSIGIGTLVYEARRVEPDFLKRKPKEERMAQEEPITAESAEDDRQQIKLVEERINAIARQCAGMIADEMFMRGSLPAVLVRVEEAPGARDANDGEHEPGVLIEGVRHTCGSLVFAEPTAERIQFRLDDKVLFLRFDRRSEEWLPKSCPTALARRIIGAAAELGFRPCAGIVTVPLFIRGRVVTDRGYHARTGLILDYRGHLPSIPDKPTRQQTRRAAIAMLRPFRGYLAGLPSKARKKLRATILAAVLTAVLRPSLPGAPAILFDANQPGAGKGKMARAVATISTGRYPAIITEGHSEEETEKRLAAAILSGASSLLLDNLQRPLASSTLESGLTEGVATIRPFGKLTDTTVLCSALVLITANNAALRADMLRRTLPVRIVVNTDMPETRRFDFDPYVEAKQHRTAIIAAALTIVRAWWHVRDTDEGRRIRQTTLGSFEEWADLVAGAIEYLTGINPVSLIEERKAEDPRRGDERSLVAALFCAFGEAEWKAGEAAAKLDAQAWAGVVRFKGEKPAGREIGGWLRARRDRVFGFYALRCRTETTENVTLWRVERLDGAKPGDTGTRDIPGHGPLCRAKCGPEASDSYKKQGEDMSRHVPCPGESATEPVWSEL
jgi:hypothetical protein